MEMLADDDSCTDILIKQIMLPNQVTQNILYADI